MRKISAMPGGYDRTHRLTGLKGGKDRLKELIRDQGGYQFIEYLTKADGGKNLGLMLGSVKGGKDFNSPTGFLYTENALAGKLRELHNRDLADEAKKAQGASQ